VRETFKVEPALKIASNSRFSLSSSSDIALSGASTALLSLRKVVFSLRKVVFSLRWADGRRPKENGDIVEGLEKDRFE
jgi:hypothetical protein